MKKSIVIMALAIALGTTVSCNKKEETTKQNRKNTKDTIIKRVKSIK